jgi:hypothetical protein
LLLFLKFLFHLCVLGVKKESIAVSLYKDIIDVEIPISIASKMLHTKFGAFRALDDRRVVLPRITQPYFLPAEIAELVSVVDNIMRFPSIRKSKPTTSGSDVILAGEFDSCGTKCSGYTTPAVLLSAYNITLAKTVSGQNSVAVAEFQYQYCK